MYALLVEVDANESHIEKAREFLPVTAVPNAKEMGAFTGYWLAPTARGAVSVLLFETEEQARAASGQLSVGPTGRADGINFTAIDVCEVLASF